MSFLEKYYKGIERGESPTEWRAIELADKEVKELWGAINQLRKRIRYDEADDAKLQERVDGLVKEIEALKADRDELQGNYDDILDRLSNVEDDIEILDERVDNIEDDVRRLDVFTEGDGDIDGTEEDI